MRLIFPLLPSFLILFQLWSTAFWQPLNTTVAQLACLESQLRFPTYILPTANGRYLLNAEREPGVINDTQSLGVEVLVLFLCAQWDERFWVGDLRMKIWGCLPAPEFGDPTGTEEFPSGGPSPGTAVRSASPLAPSLLRCRTTPTPAPTPTPTPAAPLEGSGSS